MPAFSTKDVDPKSSGGSEERIGPAETDVVAAKKNAPQRAPNKAVFKPLPIFFLPQFQGYAEKVDRRGVTSTAPPQRMQRLRYTEGRARKLAQSPAVSALARRMLLGPVRNKCERLVRVAVNGF
jgi:hypothetical protein